MLGLNKQWSLRTQGASLVLAVSLLGISSTAHAQTVGDPNNPAGLQAAILSAYVPGKTIIITPGTYMLPQNNSGDLILNNLANFEIDAYNVTFVTAGSSDGVFINNCQNLVLKGPALKRDTIGMSQGKIIALGSDPNNAGVFVTVQVDAGYPVNPGWGYNLVMLGNSRSFKPLSYDLGFTYQVDQLANNQVKIHCSNPKNFNGWSVKVGDWLTTHINNGPQLHFQSCSNCTLQDVTELTSPSWCGFREDHCAGNHYLHDTITYAPAPAGATNAPLLSTGSGMQAIADTLGPDVEQCLFEGTSDDGFDLRGLYATVTAVSGNTVTVDQSPVSDPICLWAVNDPIRLSDTSGGYQDTTVPAVAQIDTYHWKLTLNAPLTISVGTSITAKASNPNENCPGYKIINTTVRNNRARGVLAKGDNGLVQGCTLSGNTMSAIQLGSEYSWNESDYVHNVTVQDNTINFSGYASQNVGGTGGIFIGLDGALGNQNITIRNNLFTGVYGPNIIATCVDGLNISWNVFANTYSTQVGNGAVISLNNANSIVLTQNLVTAAGPYQSSLVTVGNATNIVNNNNAGITGGILSSGVYKLTHVGTSNCLNVSGNSTKDGASVQQSLDNGTAAQQWVTTGLAGGNYTVAHIGTSKVLEVPGGSLAVGAKLDQWTNQLQPWQQWSFLNNGDGTASLTNLNSGLLLDVPGNSTASSVGLDQSTPSNTTAQRWVMTLLKATPGTNLIQNGSFEADGFTFLPQGWSITSSVANTVYAQSQNVAQNDACVLVIANSNPHSITATQTVGGLANGLYTLTAYIEEGNGLAQKDMYVTGYAAGAPSIQKGLPSAGGGMGGWQKVTITDIPVSSGQCQVGFSAQDPTGGHVLYIDNVQFFKQ